MKSFVKSMIIMLSVTLGILNVDAPTVQAATPYSVWVGGVQITSDNQNDVLGDGTVSYVPTSGDNWATLYLENANIAKDYTEAFSSSCSYAGPILSKENLRIEYSGNNTVTMADYNSMVVGAAIYMWDDCSVLLSGGEKDTLTLHGGVTNEFNYAIAGKTITIQGGSVVADVKKGYSTTGICAFSDCVIEKGATVNVSSNVASALSTQGKLTISDSTLVAVHKLSKWYMWVEYGILMKIRPSQII